MTTSARARRKRFDTILMTIIAAFVCPLLVTAVVAIFLAGIKVAIIENNVVAINKQLVKNDKKIEKHIDDERQKNKQQDVQIFALKLAYNALIKKRINLDIEIPKVK